MQEEKDNSEELNYEEIACLVIHGIDLRNKWMTYSNQTHKLEFRDDY